MIIDPKLDLVLERTVDVPPELVWLAWTQPEHLQKWFTPKPWTTTACEIDLRPGGAFITTMRSPEGQDFRNFGCYLEIVPHQKLVWTDTLEAGYRPSRQPPGENCPFRFTATLILEPAADAKGTKYTAIVLHGDESSRQKHEAMGFHEGWGTALDQLVEHVKQTR